MWHSMEINNFSGLKVEGFQGPLQISAHRVFYDSDSTDIPKSSCRSVQIFLEEISTSFEKILHVACTVHSVRAVLLRLRKK